ncbi:potassium-transporting ATPase subunit C [Williamsia sterculiae]|uniref:Potassium-transporting ATPase KdpC subunit n=1 Tax=Williamsia sterculiae TaxID=1344003 RepID=A0A1N7GIX9_9NOCA|nr:potassium-transporting ATPase subunit C [Williamsia sterculiae]SIS12551.1 K+-transporting ATPase ATPase C chain [Williamsia sterculiae]
MSVIAAGGVRTWTRQLLVSAAVLVALTVILGGAYPAVVWAISRTDSTAAEGAIARDVHGCSVGSTLLGVDPQVPAGQPDRYLHGRVVGSADNPMAPGAADSSVPSNQGPSSESLARSITARRTVIAAREGVPPSAVPVDAVTGSGSSLDPDISPAYAALQIPRIARVTGRSASEVRRIVDDHTTDRQWGFLGQPRVNVLEVNLALGATAPGCR